MSKQQIINNIMGDLAEVTDVIYRKGILQPIINTFEDRLYSALDRYAFSIVEQSIPAASGSNLGPQDGWNACREKTLQTARELTNQNLPHEENH